MRAPSPSLSLLGAIVAFMAIVAVPVAAQPAPLRTEALAPGVYAILRTPAPTAPADPNTLVIVNERDVIVVDANITPGSSRRVIAEIKRLTRHPVRYVINTHYHSDHHYGNMAYRAEWPGVEFVGHEETRRMVISSDLPTLRPNVDSLYPAEVRRLEGLLRSGAGPDGAALTPERRTRIEGTLAGYRDFLLEARGLEMIPPTLTFADSLVLQRGERTIVVRWLGRGNTAGDAVVWLPRERILATGDLVVAPIPYAFESFPTDWPTTLATLRSLPANFVMPGHGPVQRDWWYVDRLSTLLCRALDRIRLSMTPSITLDSLRARSPLAAEAATFGATDEGERRSFGYLFEAPFVERAFKEMRAAGTAWTRPAGCRPA